MADTNISYKAIRTMLVQQLERLSDTNDDTCGTREQIENELMRTKGMCEISKQLVDIGKLQLSALVAADDHGYDVKKDMPLLSN